MTATIAPQVTESHALRREIPRTTIVPIVVSCPACGGQLHRRAESVPDVWRKILTFHCADCHGDLTLTIQFVDERRITQARIATGGR